jgi:hypothetical protein
MVARLLMHPLAENIFTFLSVGLVLFSVGLIGSLLWGALPSPADASPVSASASASATSVTSVSLAADNRSLVPVQYVDCSAKPSLAACKR